MLFANKYSVARIFAASAIWLLCLLTAGASANDDLTKIQGSLDSHTASLNTINSYLAPMAKFWDWYSQFHERIESLVVENNNSDSHNKHVEEKLKVLENSLQAVQSTLDGINEWKSQISGIEDRVSEISSKIESNRLLAETAKNKAEELEAAMKDMQQTSSSVTFTTSNLDAKIERTRGDIDRLKDSLRKSGYDV